MSPILNFDKHYCEVKTQLLEALYAMSIVLEEMDFLGDSEEAEKLQAKALYVELCKLLGVVEGWIILYNISCDDNE